MSTLAVPQTSTTTWNIDPAHSVAEFKVKHMMISNVKGQFAKVSGVLTFDEANLANSRIDAMIEVSSIATGDAQRDTHLRSVDFFDVEKFPEISFVSNGLVAKGNSYELTGDLTIKGVTRQVTLETEFNGVAVDPFGNTRAGVSAETTISRKDFGLTWNAVLEAGGVLVSDKVAINLELAFIAPAA